MQSRTEVALKVSNTTGADTSKAADQLTAIWNGFNVGAEDAEKSIDVIAAVAANTASNLDEMATAMSKVASMANSMGVSEELLASQISTVIAVTRLAPESVGTAFKTIYARIADIKAGSEDAEISLGNYSGLLAALGINVLDTAGNLKDMGQIIEEVGTSWGNYSKELQVAIAGIMGGQRQVNQLRALFDNWDKYTETMKITADAEGTLQQQQDTYMESAEGQLQMLRTEWEGVLDSLLKAEDIVNVAKKIQPILVNLEKLIDAFGGGIGILLKFSPLLISIVSPQISQGIGKMVNSFQAALTNMKLAQLQATVWNATMKDTLFTDKYALAIKSLGADYVSLMNAMSAELRNDFLASMQRFIDITAPAVKLSLADVNAAFESLKNEARGALLIGENDDLNSTIQKCENLEKSINILDTTFTETSNKMKRGFRLNDAIDSVVSEVESLGLVYGTLPEPIDKVRLAVLHYQGVMKDANHTTEEAKLAKEAIMIAYENALEYVNEDRQGLVRYIETLKDYIRNVLNADESLLQMNNTTRLLNTELIASSFVSVTQGLISIVNAVNLIKNLGKIWDDEDLTNSEKLALILTTIGSVIVVTIPSIMGMITAVKTLSVSYLELGGALGLYNALSGATVTINGILTKEITLLGIGLKLLNKKEIEHIILENAASVAIFLHVAATEGLIVAISRLTKALIALNAAMKFFVSFSPILLAVAAAVGAVVLAYKYWEHRSLTTAEAMEKEKEKLQEIIDGYENLKKGVEEYSKSVDELHKLTKGTDEYNLALEELNKKVQELIEKYPKLRAAMRYEGNEMVLDLTAIDEVLEEEENKANAAQREVLKKGIVKDINNYNDKDKTVLETYENFYWVTDEERKGIITGEGLESNKNTLTEIAKTYKKYSEISSETMSLIIKKYQDWGLTADLILEKLENNTDEVKSLAIEIEERNKKFESKGIKIDAVLSGNVDSVSKKEYKELINMSDEELRELGLVTNEEILNFKNNLFINFNEAFSGLPDIFNKGWDAIDKEIIEKFRNEAGKIDDEILEKLGTGLENLGDNIDIDLFTSILQDIDWSQGEDSLNSFNEQIKDMGLSFESLPQEILNYIEALLAANTIWNKSINILGKLSNAMGKISTMKFGDMLSLKDYDELINNFEGLEKYFLKVGDKYLYVAKNNRAVLEELKKAYREQKEELGNLSISKDNAKGLLGLSNGLRQSVSVNLSAMSVNNELKKMDILTLSSASGYDTDTITKLLNSSISELSEEEYNKYLELIKSVIDLKDLTLEKDKELIYSTINTTEELLKAVDNNTVSQEAADEMFEIVHEREIALLEEQRLKTLDLIKADEEYKRSQNQNERSKVEKKMESAEGDEWVKLYKERQRLIKEEEASLRRLLAAQLVLLNLHKADLETRITEVATEDELKEIDLTRITDMIKKGSSWAEIEGVIGKGLDKNSDTYNTILELYELINGEARELELTVKDTNDLIEELVVKINRENSGLLDSLEAQKNAAQRKISKTENRMAHATGQEWLDLYNQRENEKSLYKSILNTEYTNLGTTIANRKSELLGIDDFTGNVSFDENGLAILKEGANLSLPLQDAALSYNAALKESISLGYEIADLDEKQYITIDKLANEKRAIASNQKEINRLEKEATYLTGDALLNNLKKQNELRERNAKLQAKQLADSKLELAEAQNTLQSIVGDKVKIDFDISGGVANIEEVLETFNGTEFAEEVQNWINKVNDCADATQELEEAFLDFVEKLDSNYDEKNEIKGLERQKDILETLRKNVEKGSPEYERYTKEIQDLDKLIRDLKLRELKEYKENELANAKAVLDSRLENKNPNIKWTPKYDNNNIVTNVEDLLKEIDPEDWKKISEGNLSEEELTALIEKYGDIKALQEAILDYNEKQNVALDLLNDIAKDNITKWDEKRELLKDTHDWTLKNLEELKSILELEGSGLYGDDKITNLEKQADILHLITKDAEKQVKDLEDYIKQLKTAGADASVIALAEADLKDYKKSALEAEKKEQDEIKKILQEKVKIVEEEIKRETNAQHQLKNQLKEIDRALTKIKKDLEGLSGNALVAKMQEEVALQELKKKILELQLAIIKELIQTLIALYSAEFSKQFNVPINFVVDENGVANPDLIESALSKVAPEQEALAREMANSWMSTLNSLASNWSSLQSSIDSMSDSIDSLNKKMKETAEAEAFRVKEEKWYLEEQAIKRVEKELAKLLRIQKHLTGPALIKNLEQQQKLLEKQAEAQARKLSLMKGELQTMQAMLALQGVMFSEDGLIANYAEIAALGNDKLAGYLKSYQSLYESIMDLEEGIQETFDKKLDLEYEKAAERLRMFNAKIDVELDLGKAKREWLNFKREFLNTLNGMQQLNDSLAEKAKLNLKDIMDISARETPMLTDHVNLIMNEIAVMQAGGWSDLYGDDQATALSDLANYRQLLLDSLSAVADKIKEVEESYLQLILKIKGKFDEQLSNYELIQSIIDHDMNLIKLLKGSEAYDLLTNYYDKSTKNYESEILMLRNQVTYWKNLMDLAQPGSKEWEEFLSNWKDALSKLNSAVDSAIQNLMDKYENLINKILSDMEKKFTGGVKLDYLKQQWDWANDEADLYLDKISQEYNIQKLTYKYQEAANKINDPTLRAKVLKIMDLELSKLKEKDKLTKYDVERANKIYDLRMKELELEDASLNKTKMRLRRDAEGNYRYEYVADLDKVAELKLDILDMEEEIRQFDLSSLREKKEESIKILQEFIDEARELTSMKREGEITEEEYEKRLEELKNHYKNMYEASADAIDNISNNLTESTTQEMIDLDMITLTELNKMTKDAIDALVKDISPIYNDTINDMIGRIAGAGGFTEITKEAMESLVSVFYDFDSELEAIELAADVSFDAIISGIDETIDEMQALIEDNDELLTQYQEELDVIVALIDELHDLENAYRDVYDAAVDAVDAALELRQTYLDNLNYEDANAKTSELTAESVTSNADYPIMKTNTKTKTDNTTKENDNTYVLFWEDGKYKMGLDNNGDLTDKVGMVANIKGTKSGEKHYQVAIDGRGTKEDMLKLKKLLEEEEKGQSFATGGYTGEWGSEGRIAMLHEKELVLNKDDTANILQAVNQTRQGSMGFDSTLISVMSLIGNTVSAIYSVLLEKTASDILSSAATAANISNTLANAITNNINANFPNAGNMNEIKNALMSFSNYASQQTHLNKRINSATTANAYRLK